MRIPLLPQPNQHLRIAPKTFDYQIVRHNFTFKLALVYIEHYPSPSICKKTTLLL